MYRCFEALIMRKAIRRTETLVHSSSLPIYVTVTSYDLICYMVLRPRDQKYCIASVSCTTKQNGKY